MDLRASVIIPSYNAARTIARCLRSLERQPADARFETIVVDSSTDGTADVVAREFPRVRLIRAEARMFPGDARNIGAAHAKAPVLIFLDADCFVGQEWMNTLLPFHESARRAVGVSLLNANPTSYVGWAHYFFDLTPWLPLGSPRRIDHIPGSTLSVHRLLFEEHGPFAEGVYSSDTGFCWALQRGGCEMLFVPSAGVYHENITAFGELLRSKLARGRAFAAIRTLEHRLSPARRLTYAAGACALPPVLVTRIARRVSKDRGLTKRFLLVSPLVFLAAVAWSLGESAGYLSTQRSTG